MVHFVSFSDHVSTRGPTRAVAACLASLARDRPERWFLEEGTLGKLMQPLRVWCRVVELEDDLRQSQVSLGQLRTVTPVVLENVVAVLCALLESPEIAKSLARDDDAAGNALGHLIHFVTLAFERHQSYDCAFLLSALALAERLAMTHLGPLSPRYTGMVHTLAEVSLELKDTAVTPTASGALGQRQKEELEQNSVLAEKLKRTLVGFLGSPKSCLSLIDACERIDREDGEDVLAHAAKGELSSLSEESGDTFPLLSLFRPGLRLLAEQRFVERRLLAMLEVFTLEGDNKHWRPSPQEAEQRMLRSTTLFSSLLSSFDMLREALDGDNLRHYKMLRDLLLFDATPFPNYSEGESVFALKILSCVLGGLDALVHMETVHGITGKLRGAMRTNGEGMAVIDREALYIHHICQSARAIGGAGERALPRLSFEERDSWDLRWDAEAGGGDDDPGDEAIPSISASCACPLSRFLSATKDKSPDAAWLEEARRQLRRSVASAAGAAQTLGERGALLGEVVAKFHSALAHVPEEAMPPRVLDLRPERIEEDGRLHSSLPENSAAVRMLLNYGKSCLEIPPREQDLLCLVNKRAKGRHEGQFRGFDWFVGVAFLLCEGDVERCDSLLNKLCDCAASFYLWPSPGIPNGEHDPRAALVHVGHHVETVLAEDVGLVHSTLRSEGISAALVCRRWTSQCFLNFLPMSEICSYVTLVALHGPDYVVFSCVALFKHLQNVILDAVAAQLENGRYLVEILLSAQIEGFTFAKSMEFIEELDQKHGSAIRSDLIRVARMHNMQ